MIKRINFTVCSIISIFCLIAVIYKAWNCSLTHDEAYSFLHYANRSSIDILSFDQPYTNSHILNTLFMKWSSYILGTGEFALRLPNVLCILPYMYYSYRLFKQLKHQILVIPAFVLIVANPFLLDFFCLARGYGLAISLIISSMYFYAKYLHDEKWKFYMLSLILGGISVLANFTSLYYFIMLLGIHFLLTAVSFWSENKKEKTFIKYFYQHNKVTFIFLPVYALVMYEPFRRLAKLTIDFGGTKGMWQDTVMTLIYASEYGKSQYGFQILLQVLVLFTAISVVIFWIFVLLSKKKEKYRSYFLSFFIHAVLGGILIQCFLLHQIKGTPYLTDRMALFLYPLFWMSFVFLMDQPKWKITAIPLFLISIFFLIHTTRSFSGFYYYFWNHEANNHEMLSRLQIEHNHLEGKEIQLGISWCFEPSLNYYRLKDHLTWLKPLTRDRLQPADDYCYILWNDSAWVSNNKKYQLLERYPISNTSLYKVVQE